MMIKYFFCQNTKTSFKIIISFENTKKQGFEDFMRETKSLNQKGIADGQLTWLLHDPPFKGLYIRVQHTYIVCGNKFSNMKKKSLN